MKTITITETELRKLIAAEVQKQITDLLTNMITEEVISNINIDICEADEQDEQIIVYNYLQYLRIPPHIDGFRYLLEAVPYAISNPDFRPTKDLYPDVSKKCETTAFKVERAIRHAIEVAWDKPGSPMKDIFKGDDRPTNSEFITLVADTLKLQNPKFFQ